MEFSLLIYIKIFLIYSICIINGPRCTWAGSIINDISDPSLSDSLYFGNEAMSKKSLDFDPDDEITYNDDEIDKTIIETPSIRDHISLKDNMKSNNINPTKREMNSDFSKMILDRRPDDDSNSFNLKYFSKKDDVNNKPAALPSLKCDPDDNSKECLCQKSCLPNMVHNFFPCQCIEILDNTSDQEQPSHNNEENPSSNSNVPPLLINPAKDKATDNNPSTYIAPSACDNACSPYVPLSQNPCLCDVSPTTKSQVVGSSDANTMPSTEFMYYSQPQGVSTYNNMDYQYSYPKPNTYSFNTMSYTYPSYDNYYNYDSNNYYPPSSSYDIPSPPSSPPPTMSVSSQMDPNIKVKCKKACFPFVVKHTYPCTCDFNSYKSPYDQNDINTPNARSFSNYQEFSTNSDPSYDFLKGFMHPAGSKKFETHSQDSMDTYNYMGTSKHEFPTTDTRRKQSYAIPRYIGCFKDESEHGRDLKIDVPIDELTVDKCVKVCRKKKKRFAGLQYGYLCFCGSRFGRYGRASDRNCTTHCVGDPLQMCGGSWFNSIYSTDGQLYSETQFSFSTPDSMDEIKAEEEKNKLKSKILPLLKSSKKRTNHHLNSKKLSHSKLKNTEKSEVALKKGYNKGVSLSDDGYIHKKHKKINNKRAHNVSGMIGDKQLKNVSTDNAQSNLKNKLKVFYNKTFEKSEPPQFEPSKLGDDESPFYKTQNNPPDTVSHTESDIVNVTNVDSSDETNESTNNNNTTEYDSETTPTTLDDSNDKSAEENNEHKDNSESQEDINNTNSNEEEDATSEKPENFTTNASDDSRESSDNSNDTNNDENKNDNNNGDNDDDSNFKV